jgi:hypothetical protein
VTDEFEIGVSPEPDDDDREAILVAVEELLRREATLATPAAWRLVARTQQRIGITDLGRFVPDGRRWALSTRTPWGGREFPGLNGRGDAK